MRQLGATVAVAVTFLLAACSSNRNGSYDEPPEVVRIRKKIPYHTVNDGETVGDIATKYDMTRSELIKLNDLKPPYQLYTGQRLLIRIKVDDVPSPGSSHGGGCSLRLPDAETPFSGVQPVGVTPSDDDSGKNAISSDILNGPGDVTAAKPNDAVVEEAVTGEYEWPVAKARGRIIQRFGDDGADGGIVIDASAGTPVRAISDGVVVISGVPGGEAAAYGLTVVIKHPAKKKMSIYANLQETTVDVKSEVKKGGIIGKVGKSGSLAKKAQLYFEVRDVEAGANKAIDPEKLLP